MSFLAVAPVRASYTITITQVGPNVVATGSGSLNTAGTSILVTGSTGSSINSSQASIQIGPVSSVSTDARQPVSGPTAWGSGTNTSAGSGSGEPIGLSGFGGVFGVPHGFIAGDLGTSVSTWSNQTFSTLGLTPGIYVYTLPSDTFTVDILPEPASLSLLALAGLAMGRRRGR